MSNMNKYISALLFPILLSSCNGNGDTKQEINQDSTAQVEADTISVSSDTLTISSSSDKIDEEENEEFYVDSNCQKYSIEQYHAIFDSLAKSIVPHDSILINGNYKKEYSEDKKVTITYLPNTSKLTRVRAIDNGVYLCYEFRSKVNNNIVMGYLLYSREIPVCDECETKYKLIKKNDWLLSGQVQLVADISYTSDNEGLNLSYHWECSCCTETIRREGTYNLNKGLLLYSSIKDAMDDDSEGTIYGASQTIESYYRISTDSIKYEATEIKYKGNTDEIKSQKDSTHIHILTPEDIDNGKDKELMSIPELGMCC